jgi:hypothetical protein
MRIIMNSNVLRVSVIGLSVALSASAAIAEECTIVWEGDGGYSAEGYFSYDGATAPPVIFESGTGPTNDLDTLTVTFRDPSGTSFQLADNVVNGVSDYSYLAFEFDTVLGELLFFDIGKDDGLTDDTYLAGNSSFATLLQVGQGAIDEGPNVEVICSSAPAAVCDLDLSFSNGTLTTDIELGASQPTTWNLWVNSGLFMIPIVSAPIPSTPTPFSFSFDLPIPTTGIIGMLTTMTTPEDGIVCSDWETVRAGADFGVAADRPTHTQP